ncbi:MAG: hypothetical protein WCT05_02400, partial [Lentisphaeria bacterium]
PKCLKNADFQAKSGFIGLKSTFYEDRHRWGTVIDDARIYSRALTPVEVSNAYARLLKDRPADAIQSYEVRLNGVDKGPCEKLDKLEAEFDFSALPEDLALTLVAGKLNIDYKLTAPDGKLIHSGQWLFSQKNECRIFSGIDQVGPYVLETTIGGGHRVLTKIIRPDLSFAYNGLGDEDEVPALWRDFAVDGRNITLWNRRYRFGGGPLPESITIQDRELFLTAPTLHLDERVITWKAGSSSRSKRSVTFNGSGRAGDCVIDYATTVEYDGFLKVDWTIREQPEISAMYLTWQVAPEFRRFLMTPTLQDPTRNVFEYPFDPNANMLWLVSPHAGGFAFACQHDANWIYDTAQPVRFVNRETGECRVEMIQKNSKLPADVSYEALFITTPVRPLPERNRVLRFGDDIGLIHGGGDGGFQDVGSFVPHPTDFEYRMKTRRPWSASVYGLANALTDDNEMVQYFWKYWRIPRGAVCQMPWHKPLGEGKYEKVYNTLLLFCNATALTDYYLNNQLKIYQHPYGDRVFQIYYDHCGSSVCRNPLHGCSFKDRFGREIWRNEIVTKRELIKRTVALAHRYGRSVMCHGQRSYYPMQCGMADYWLPGEQHTAAIQRNFYVYTDEIPDEIWQSEYNRDVLGIGVVFLPAIWYAKQGKHVNDQTTDAMISMLQLHDIDSTHLWAKPASFRKLWDILEKYEVQKTETQCHLYYEDNRIKSSNPDIRVTWYECPGNRTLIFLSNQTPEDEDCELDLSAIASGDFTACEEYDGKELAVVSGKVRVSVPGRSYRILAFPPRPFYPQEFDFSRLWSFWKGSESQDEYALSYDVSRSAKASFQLKCNGTEHRGCFLKNFPAVPGRTYEASLWVLQNSGENATLAFQGQDENQQFLGTPVQRTQSPFAPGWRQLSLTFQIPTEGRWSQCRSLLVTFGGQSPDNSIWFDDFSIDEK